MLVCCLKADAMGSPGGLRAPTINYNTAGSSRLSTNVILSPPVVSCHLSTVGSLIKALNAVESCSSASSNVCKCSDWQLGISPLVPIGMRVVACVGYLGLKG